MAHAIRDTLKLEGEPDWDIQVAEGGERALALAASHPPNVVLLDVNLPDLDGAEVYRRLRIHPGRWTDGAVPDGGDLADLDQRGIEAGVVLRKPFEMRDLVSRCARSSPVSDVLAHRLVSVRLPGRVPTAYRKVLASWRA